MHGWERLKRTAHISFLRKQLSEVLDGVSPVQKRI